MQWFIKGRAFFRRKLGDRWYKNEQFQMETFYRFDTGSGPVILRSKNKISPGKLYSVELTRKLREGELKLSGEPPVVGSSPGSTRGLNIRLAFELKQGTVRTTASNSIYESCSKVNEISVPDIFRK